MPIDCEIILRWEAKPEQLTAMGLALWRWCLNQSADTDTYPYLNNQVLSDLIAGEFPGTDPSRARRAAGQPGFHFYVQAEGMSGIIVAIESMRRAIPQAAIEDLIVADTSWRQAEGATLMSV